MLSNNTIKTALLLGLLTGFLMLIGGALGGTGGMIFAFVFAIAINMGAWWFSDSIALKFSGAYPVNETEAPEPPYGGYAGGAGRDAQTARLYDRQPAAQRFRNWSQPGKGCGCSHDRYHAINEPG